MHRNCYLPYHNQAPTAPVIYSIGTPEDVVASGSSLVLPRAAAGTRDSTLHYTGASIARRAMQKQ
jgi:hypothetical protein